MVVDTTYYEALEVKETATGLEIKKAYRRLAIQLHPDKNPGDETAHEKFQAIGEAYQVLSDEQLRAKYDKFGKESAQPSSGFEDPAEFFSMIFGGDAFSDWIGEISLMKDLTKTMELSTNHEEGQEASAAAEGAAATTAAAAGTTPAATTGTAGESEKAHAAPAPAGAHPPPPNVETPAHAASTASTVVGDATPPAAPSSERSTPRPQGIPIRPAIAATAYDAEEQAHMNAAGITPEEKELREKQRKKGGLTKEQREELYAFEMERKRIRDERVNVLAEKLVNRISLWTETDKGVDVTAAFREQMKVEVEHLRMESFGLEILHAIGYTYTSKATSFLKSQKFLGVSGFFSRLKDKGNLVKETWGTISTALDASMTMEEMAKAEERGGEDWTDEKKAEYEKRVTGKILAAAWRGSKYEIQGVLRDVVDKTLHDKNVRLEKRVERAQALIIIGEIFGKAERDPEEEGDFMAFEQLMAEAAAKKKEEHKGRKGKKDERKKEKQEASAHNHHFGHQA